MIRKAMLVLLTVPLLSLMTVGCVQDQNKNLPFYEFGYTEDGSAELTVDGVRYMEPDLVGALGNAGKWIFTNELGEPIGVCGGEKADGGKYTIYEVEGDENHNFFYMNPSHFVFGPYLQFLGIKEGISLELPTAEAVSRIVATCHDEDSKLVELSEFKDEALINTLLDIYYAGDADVVPSGLPSGVSLKERDLNLYHSEYPFLYFYIRCLYDEESGEVYLQCANNEYRRLPRELEEQIGVAIPEGKKGWWESLFK